MSNETCRWASCYSEMENVSSSEQQKFSALADDWWDPNGSSRTLHEINPCRLEYVQRRLDLAGSKVADIGCGGGLFSEALALAGATVTAIDATDSVIDIARTHAAQNELNIDYRVQLSRQLAASESGTFDAVVCMELIEHVPDPAALVADCGALLRDGGQLFISTLTRTPVSYALAILGAEYVLGLVPRGTHDYEQFLKPAEIGRLARTAGLTTVDVTAMQYNPAARAARLGGSVKANYLATFIRES